MEMKSKNSYSQNTSMRIEVKDSHSQETHPLTEDLCSTQTPMRIEIKQCTCIEMDDFLLLKRLSHTNCELVALLYGGYRRNEVIYALREPEEYLTQINNLFARASKMFEELKEYAIVHCIDISNISDAELKCLVEARDYVFHFFTSIRINTINNCYLYIKGDANINIFNLNLSIHNSISALSKMKQDLLVTITLFEEYLLRCPSRASRNLHIEQHFINTDYE
jgi:hypothetical protein